MTSAGGAGGAGGAEGGSGAAGAAGVAGAAGNPTRSEPPETLRLTGSAKGNVEGVSPGEGGAAGAPALPAIERVECSFYADLLELEPDAAGGWSGLVAGEVFRVVYAGGRRFEFSAFVGGPATLTVEDERVELRAVGDQTGAKPFWRELEVLEGEQTGEYRYAGGWACASLELNEPGFPDVGGVVTGSWELVPLDK